jgi:hypothetical protein
MKECERVPTRSVRGYPRRGAGDSQPPTSPTGIHSRASTLNPISPSPVFSPRRTHPAAHSVGEVLSRGEIFRRVAPSSQEGMRVERGLL